LINTVAAAAILYLISLAEGIRQLPEDAIVLCRFRVGRWRVSRHGTLGAGLRLVSWCLPVSVPLVLTSSPSVAARDADEITEAMREYERPIDTLRLLGLITLVALVVGLPVAVERSGLFGLIVVGDGLVALTAIQALWVRRILLRQGLASRPAALAALKLINPFGAPRAPELVYGSIVAGMPALDVAHELLGDAEFVRAFRPAIYDVLHDRATGTGLGLTRSIGARLASLLEAAPAGVSGNAFCPRCATEFSGTVARCSDCDDVALVQPTND